LRREGIKYNGVVGWWHPDCDLVAWRNAVHPELVEILVCACCGGEEEDEGSWLQHIYKKMKAWGWRQLTMALKGI